MTPKMPLNAARLELARLPSPIESLERASARIGREIWIKRDDQTDTLATGNKIRKLEYSIAEARRSGATTLITCGAAQSNHARATAALGVRLGFAVRLVLLGDPGDRDRGNHLLDRLLGARIRYVDLEGWHDRKRIMAEEAADVAHAGGLAQILPEGGSDVVGTLGYVRAAFEILEQEEALGRSFAHVVCALGTGGTMAGLAAGFALAGRGPLVHGVCVCNDAEYFRTKTAPLYEGLRRDYFPDFEIDRLRVNIVEGCKGRGYGKSDAKLRQELAELGRLEGIILDPVYTMKAWRGLRLLVDRGDIAPTDRILFLHTGGIFGLIAQGGLFRADSGLKAP